MSLATPSPSEGSSEEDYEGEDITSRLVVVLAFLSGFTDLFARVDAGEIDEFGMVITDNEAGEGRDNGNGKVKSM